MIPTIQLIDNGRQTGYAEGASGPMLIFIDGDRLISGFWTAPHEKWNDLMWAWVYEDMPWNRIVEICKKLCNHCKD